MNRNRTLNFLVGDLIQGRYCVGGELGRGGMSVVYRVHDQWLGRDVALKILRLPEEDTVSSLYLQQEFRAMARLRHPRLVEVYDYGTIGAGTPFFTMELLAGTDLINCPRLGIDEIYRVLISICEGLAFMHSRGYVHRDVKPANVRVLSRRSDEPIEVKLMDCGLVEQLGDRGGARGGAVAGTFHYLAPEAWLGAPADVRRDLYALGVLAYEITAGHLPFESATGVELLRTKSDTAPDLREVRPDVPVAFARLVRDLIAAEPANRPAHALEVLARLREFAAVDIEPGSTVYLRNPALVGRTRELGELRKALFEVARGKSAMVAIVGPAGAGKTRLLDEILLEAGLRGSLIARTRGRGFGGAPYEALHALLAPLLRAPGTADAVERIGGSAALGPLWPGSLSVAAPEFSDRAGSRHSFYSALCRLLDGLAAERSLVLAIDDLHTADAASLEALEAALGSRAGRVALLGTLRSDQSMPLPAKKLVSSSRLLVLERITSADITELLVRTLGPVEPGSTLVGDIQRLSGGNISFVLEILRNLAQRGLIEPLRSRVRLPEALDAPDLPRSLAEALEHRVGALSRPALAVARVAAVAGGSLDLDLVRALAQLEGEPFLDALDELRREELVDVQALGMSVRHPRLREVLYRAIDLEQRKSLHRRFAAALDQCSESERRERAAELGHHYAEGGADRRALECLVLAGDIRYEGFAYFDAGEAYRRALGLLHAAPRRERNELERKLHDRLGRIGFYHDHQSAAQHLEQAQRLHLRHGLLWLVGPLGKVLGPRTARTLGLALTVCWNVLMFRRHPIRLAIQHLADSFAATAYLCNCHTYAGHLRRALEASESLRPFIHAGRRSSRVGYLTARAPVLLYTNRLAECASACEEAFGILTSHDHLAGLAEHDRVHATSGALITRLWCDLTRGYLSSPWWQRLEEYVGAHPTALLEAWLTEARLYAAYRQGDLEATRLAWQSFVEKAKWAEVLFIQGKGRVWLGMACLEAGQTSEAQDVADDVMREGREKDNPMLQAMGLLLRGMALHAWEQLGDAARALEEAALLTQRDDLGCQGIFCDVLLAQAALSLDLKDDARASELAQQVDRACSGVELADELHRLRALRVLGQVALRREAAQEAIERFTQSLELAERIEDPFERALGLHALGQALSAMGDDTAATARREEAKQLLLEHGRTYQLRRLGYTDRGSRDNIERGEAARPAADGGGDAFPLWDDPASHLGDTQAGWDTSALSRSRPIQETELAAAAPSSEQARVLEE